MDYSRIDKATKEELAERVAVAVLKIEDLGMFGMIQSEAGLNSLLEVRRDLIQLVKELGGHPAIP